MTHYDDIAVASGTRAAPPPGAARVLETLRHDAVTELGGVLSGFWSGIEEQVRLAALAGHDYMAAQDDRVAVLDLSHRALELATRFRKSIEREFDLWLADSAEREVRDSLSLMSEGQLEVHLAGQQIVELMDHQFLHPLATLDDRLQVLAAQLGIRGAHANPLRPEVPVKAFMRLFEADELPPGLRTMVFRQFDKRLPAILGEVYERANATLDAASIGGHAAGARSAPHPQQRVARPAHDAAPAGAVENEWIPDGGVVAPLQAAPAQLSADAATAAGSAGYGPLSAGLMQVLAAHEQGQDQAAGAAAPVHGYRDLVREQLHTWRERRLAAAAQVPAGEHGADGVGNVLSMSQLLSVTTMLQNDDPAPYARALVGEDRRPLSDVIRDQLLRGLRELGVDPERTPLSRDDEDAIDLVGILFQSLFDANDLLQQARDIYGRLVVPYLKVALTDDSMFNQRAHPARRLLDAVTEACDGNAGETPQDRDTLQHTGRVVDRVVEEYRDDQAVFELAATELRQRLDQQRRRAEVAERRAAEAIHGRERLQQARRSVDDLVASRLRERPLTAVVALFLDRHWRHHLTRTWLRDGPDSARHLAAIGVGDAMVQVDADAALALGGAVADELLALQVPLGDCYSSCGMDANAARDAMARIIAALALPDTLRRVYVPQPPEEATEDADDDPALHVAGGSDTLDFDPTVAARMRQLRVGQGLRLIDANGRESAARVAWISPLTARLLLVNRRGARRMVVSPEELAAMVGAGRAEIRAVDAPFDEAMKHLWQQLNAANDAAPADQAVG
ncbi:DUF1631 domain-containing protein [Luteimonas sp. BDR2-5]|uniref:DUF1631 family protein n=1 Tax=Proluteimonas luteida TaxID=2878685 RepID=UPI001E4ECAAF|nr:DUF1631 family protein [Luteimonas sp. BDR2-5]MCD9028936.1 DUF1631 domain-containing protein [Luteimonas sp. BDR2-5]